MILLSLFLALASAFTITDISFGRETAATIEGVFTSKPSLVDTSGVLLPKVTEGQMSVIFVDINNNQNKTEPFLAIVEVRGSDDTVTYFLQFQTGQLEPNGSIEIGISWTPEKAGNYQLRTFLISGLENPVVLTEVRTSDAVVAQR